MAKVTLQGFAPLILCRQVLPGVRTQPGFSAGMHLERLLVWAVLAGRRAAARPAAQPRVRPRPGAHRAHGTGTAEPGSSPGRGERHRCWVWGSRGELSRAVPANQLVCCISPSWNLIYYFTLLSEALEHLFLH